jgi:TPR repeat protein
MQKRLLVFSFILACSSIAAGAQVAPAVRALTYATARGLPIGRAFTIGAIKVAAAGIVGGASYDVLNNLTGDVLKNAFKPPDPRDKAASESPSPNPATAPGADPPSLCPLGGCKPIDFSKLPDFTTLRPQGLPTIAPPPAPTCENVSLDGLEALRRGANLDSDSSFAKRNPAGARSCYYIAAQQNVPIAQYNLADMLLTGDIEVAPDPVRGFQYMEAAARNGFLPAQLRLADAYDRGEGMPPDRSAAYRWYMTAANAGSSYAQYQLSRYYYYGIASPTDNVGAFIWLNTALMGGYQPALPTMNDLLVIIDGDAHAGIAGAQFTMGAAYEWGVPGLIQPDPRSAFFAYLAAQRGNWPGASIALQRVCSNVPAACL